MIKNSVEVLVVEDIAVAQKVAKITLIGLGHIVDIAENGQKALDLFEKNKYDIVFLDLGLPDMNGTEVIKRIREIENNKQHVPIVALNI
jgi:CheY-like chemotaxis protein